jgi:hypothetical protein
MVLEKKWTIFDFHLQGSKLSTIGNLSRNDSMQAILM